MLRNYILIALRTLRKQSLFSAINILGLAIGQCAAFLIILFIVDEYNANNWIENIDHHYMLESDWKEDINRPRMTTIAPLGEALKENYPNLVANYFSIDALSCNISGGANKSFRMNMQLGKGNFIEMFGLPLLHGDTKTAFIDASGIIIQKEVALKFFSRTNVIGESLVLETQNAVQNPSGKKEFTIKGVIDDLPENSITDNLGERTNVYINADNITYFRPFDMFADWNNYIVQTRLELRDGITPEDLIDPINQLIGSNTQEQLAQEILPKLTPLKIYNLIDNDKANLRLIYILAAVAGFILLMAMINFVNLSLGMARKRLREIGVRKVMGGLKWQLQIQFIAESLVLSLIALFVTLCLVQLILPSFMNVVGKNHFSNTNFYELSVIFLFLTLTIGLLSGVYPSLVLSKHSPAKALKGKMQFKANKIDAKNVMLTIQYTLALVVIMSAFMVSQQIKYITSRDKGYDAENVLVISSIPRWYSPEGVERMLGITKEFGAVTGIQTASLSYEIPDGRHGTMASLRDPEIDRYHYFGEITADENYFETYQLALKEGRLFTEADRGSNRIILNESAANTLFKKGSAVGELVAVNDSVKQEVIGVIQDFHFSSARQPIEGIVFSQTDSTKIFRYLSLKLDPNAIKETTADVEANWKKIFPLVPFEHFYMEDKLATLYAADANFKTALSIASGFALCIVLIGVFGLTIQNLAYRIKEIGIRRVLGATPSTLLKLFTKEQLLYFVLAMLLAAPVTYLIIDQWLSSFAYRIDQPISVYIISFIAISALAFLIISTQLLRTIKQNPIDSIRYE